MAALSGLMIAVLVVLCVLVCGLWLPRAFWATVGVYVGLTAMYSLALKHRMLLDVIVIAMLFVLRAIGGAEAIDVAVSPWLLTCTFMLCLFLGFGKRRCEIAMIDNSHAMRGHRPTLVRGRRSPRAANRKWSGRGRCGSRPAGTARRSPRTPR